MLTFWTSRLSYRASFDNNLNLSHCKCINFLIPFVLAPLLTATLNTQAD